MVNWIDRLRIARKVRKESGWRADFVNFYLNRAAEESNKKSDVNIVDKETDGDVGGQQTITFPEQFPAGEIQDEVNTGPEFDQFKRQREAEIGQELTQLTTERETGKTRQTLTQHGLWPESYRDDNKFEDADMKLGESENDDTDPLNDAVYPPYSQGTGPLNSRYEDVDQNKHNIVLHAAKEIDPNKGPDFLWVAVDLDGTILTPPPDNKYEDENGWPLFGEPIEGAKEALKELMDGGARVSIYTARAYFIEDGGDEENLYEAIQNKLSAVGIPFSDIYIGNKPPAHYYIDDRNIPFKGDWNFVLDVVRDKLKRKVGIVQFSGESLYDAIINHFSMDIVEEEEFKKYLKKASDPVKDTTDYHGIKIDIEWPKGSIRSYEGNDTYVTHMKCGYGYARGINGNDGEELDIYLGDGDSDIAYIIEQIKEDGSYDEDKIMLGFGSEGEAIDMYLQHMPAYMLGDIREVPVEKLCNALYGEPEDRRGEEDLVPNEEKKAFNLDKAINKLRKRKTDPDDHSDDHLSDREWLHKRQNEEQHEKIGYLLTEKEARDRFKRAVDDKEVTILPDGSAFFTGIVKTDKESQEVFDPKIEKKPKSDYVGPQTSQSGGIGGIGAESDVESSVWPTTDLDDNEFTDGLETRENRDIGRSPNTEKARFRNT